MIITKSQISQNYKNQVEGDKMFWIWSENDGKENYSSPSQS
jgi:hypothetical protein